MSRYLIGKFTSGLLALALMCTMVPVSAFAAADGESNEAEVAKSSFAEDSLNTEQAENDNVSEGKDSADGGKDPLQDPLQELNKTTLTESESESESEAEASVEPLIVPDMPSLSGVPEPLTANPSSLEGSAANLVLLVRFADDLTGNIAGDSSEMGYNAPFRYPRPDIRTEWEYLTQVFNAPDSTGYVGVSLRSYLKTVSGGKHDLVSSFPQTNAATGGVSYITLPKPRSAYQTVTKMITPS